MAVLIFLSYIYFNNENDKYNFFILESGDIYCDGTRRQKCYQIKERNISSQKISYNMKPS